MLAWERTRANWSIPIEMCSAWTLCLSRISRTSLRASLELFRCLVTVRMMKFFLPEMPVMNLSLSYSLASTFSTIIVPGWDGSLVLRMFSGIPTSLTGATESSWRTEAPM